MSSLCMDTASFSLKCYRVKHLASFLSCLSKLLHPDRRTETSLMCLITCQSQTTQLVVSSFNSFKVQLLLKITNTHNRYLLSDRTLLHFPSPPHEQHCRPLKCRKVGALLSTWHYSLLRSTHIHTRPSTDSSILNQSCPHRAAYSSADL